MLGLWEGSVTLQVLLEAGRAGCRASWQALGAYRWRSGTDRGDQDLGLDT